MRNKFAQGIFVILIFHGFFIQGQKSLDPVFDVRTTKNIKYSSALQPIPSDNSPFVPPRANVKEHTTVPVDLYMDIGTSTFIRTYI